MISTIGLSSHFDDARPTIRRLVAIAVSHMPRVLIDTTTGRLCDRTRLAEAFETLPIFNELISSMTTRVDEARIWSEVAGFYRYVMLSHKWEDGESLSIYLMEPGTGFHPHPCRLAEVPVPSLVSLPTCRGTRPLACLSPHLPRYPSPRLSLSPTCRCACPRPTTYLSPRLSPPSTCRHACSPPPPHVQVHMHMYTSSKRSYVGLLLATHVPTCPQCSAGQ